ncbi:hypothetical protein [Arsenophonus nasoniae]|uniref:Uncharacterized protein n=1 Tax=Arsenophonus nasoniae TaxID=638 RepID=A0AA95K1X1_9GAMM|nr:hypothetical protein [Arsenophonus nasoniae]WGL96286.1 hypothetical protein QE207_06885 [Arsenophonus nasoniae]
MFKYELDQTVQINISNEEGYIKGRAEYTNSCNQYCVHYLAADGRAVDGWFEEGELLPAELK